MNQTIMLNDSSLHLKDEDLPCLVTYKEKTGGSQFSITLMVDLFMQGSKILLFTAYPMAKENFLEQVQGLEVQVKYIEKEDDLLQAEKYQAMIIKSGDTGLYTKALTMVPDIQERIVLVKNIEVFDEKVFAASLGLNKIIYSGDIDTCVAKLELVKKRYKTIIVFSKPDMNVPFKLPELEKYTGYLWREVGESGVVKIIT